MEEEIQKIVKRKRRGEGRKAKGTDSSYYRENSNSKHLEKRLSQKLGHLYNVLHYELINRNNDRITECMNLSFVW